MFCQNCGKELPDDSAFCPECGAKLEAQESQPKVVSQENDSGTKACINCGARIPIDSRFCPECRTKQNDSAIPQMQPKVQANRNNQQQLPVQKPLTPEEQEKLKKRNKIIGITVASALGVCLIIGLLSAFIKPTINLNKYLEVSFDGYDTVGRATVEFDVEQFENDYEKKLSAITSKKSSGLSKYMDQEAYMEALFDSYDTSSASSTFLSNCVNGGLDQSDSLSNGDVVTYKWSCDDDYALETYGYKLKYEDVEYTVEGLEEAATFDPFDGIEVTFEGIAPNGSADVNGEAKNKVAQDFRYDIDKYNGLSNGDTVTLTVSMYYDDPVEYCINNYGLIPSPLEKTYTVEGLDSYIRSLSDVSEDSLKEMQSQAEDIYNANVAQNWGDGETLKSLTYIGSYLLTNKNPDDYWGSDNALYLVYRAQVNNYYSNDGDTYNEINNIYWYTMYTNLLVNPDGVTTVDVSSYHNPSDRVTIDTGISSGWWSTKSWYYYGYSTLDELYKSVVASNADSYNHEENIDESDVAEETPDEIEEPEMGEEGIIFPNSSEEIIDKGKIEELTDEELRYAINELYARNGYIFKDDELRAYYEKYDWYEQTVKPDDFSLDLFNDVEKENLDTMQKERDSRN